MSKQIEELSFDEIVRIGIEMEVDAFVSGTKLKSRVRSLIELGARWQYERLKKEGKITP